MTVETFVRLFHPAPWMKDALCRGSGAAFFPSETRPSRVPQEWYREAVAICQNCPVIEPCADAGRDERFGVWGGLTPNQRTPRLAVNRPAICGSVEGYRAHRRVWGTEPCKACREAYARYDNPDNRANVGGRGRHV